MNVITSSFVKGKYFKHSARSFKRLIVSGNEHDNDAIADIKFLEK